MAGKYLLTTLGCKVNQYESQQIREVLEAFGLRPAQAGDAPDIAVVNTCAVTAEASRKSRQAIRRIGRSARTPVIVVGCGATADAAQVSKLDGVVGAIGHDADVCGELRRMLPRWVEATPTHPLRGAQGADETTHTRPDVLRDDGSMKPIHATETPQADRVSTPRTTRLPDYRIMPPPRRDVKPADALTGRIQRFAAHQRAFLKVQDGCDAFCTYCIVPRLRSKPRSKPIDVAVAEAEALVEAGHREIIVTGIFLGAYGHETAVRSRWGTRRGRTAANRQLVGDSSAPLADLVDALAQVPGLERLRLSSLEPGDVTEALLECLAVHAVCVPHLHLPLQSGSDRILRRMNRQYTADAFVHMIDRVRAALDRPAITTDIIAGFPGETDEDFECSVELARYAGFCKIHAFPFSPRAMTAAAHRQAEFVDPSVVHERIRRLADVEREGSLGFRRCFVDQTERVIVEGVSGFDTKAPSRDNLYHGRADRYFEIHFETGPPSVGNLSVRVGELVSVRVERVTPTRTHGTMLHAHAATFPLPVLSNT